MSNYLFESGITKLSERIDIVTDKNEHFRNYIDHSSKKINLETNISWIIARMILVFDTPNESTIPKFKEFLDFYNKKNNSKISFDSLIDKNWIRIVLDSIELPSQVSRYFRLLEKGENNQMSTEDLNLLNLLNEFKKKSDLIEISTTRDKLLEELSQIELQLLIDKEVLKPNGDESFSVRNNNFFNYLKNEICASLWLLLSDKIPDERARTITYVNTIIHFEINWPDKLSDYFDYKELNSLQILAKTMLFDEKDLEDDGQEFNKIWLDSPMYSHIDLNQEPPQHNISGNSPFQLISNISDLKKRNHWLYEEADSVRLKYGLLLNIILQTVKYNQNDKGNIQVLFDLVNAVKKPYLVYHSCWIIKKYYQFLIPYFLLEIKTASLPFILLNEIEIKENATDKKVTDTSFDNKKDNELRTEFFKSLLSLFLDRIAFHQNMIEETSEELYQLFKFQVNSFYNNPSYTNQNNHIEERTRFECLVKLFSEIRFSGHLVGVTRPRVFPKFVNYLIERLLSDQTLNESNEYLGFNCAKFELTYQILNLSSTSFSDNELNNEEIEQLNASRKKLVCHWRELFLDYFTKDEIDVFNPETRQNDIQKVRRKSDPSSIEILNWGHFWASINENGSIQETIQGIESCFSYDNTESEDYSEINLETKAKLRFFLKTVALGLIAINRDKSQFTFLFQGIDPLINELELALKQYTIRHCISDLKKQRISVFDEMVSSLNNDIYFEPTIKLVFSALNEMDEPSLVEFHQSLLENNLDLLFLLTILNLSKSEGVIRLITKRIEGIDVNHFINSVSNVDQWKDAIIESLNSSTHFEIADPIILKIEAWLSKTSMPGDNYSNFIFRTKLMLAFKRKSIIEINQVKKPEKKYITVSPIYHLEEQRNYFLALHWGYNENHYDKAINIFNELFSNNTGDTNSRYHIFHLETLKNINIGDSDQLFIIKTKWDQFIEDAPKDEKATLKLIQPNINYTLLFHYCHCRDYESIDRIVQSLPDILKYDQQIIEPIFQSYLQRELPINASSYLTSVELYLQNNDPHILELVQTLRETINNSQRIADLSAAYNQIYSMPYKELPSVVPRSLNGKSNIQEFIFNEIIQASLILIEKINSISQIAWENKYNDLLLAIMRLRFAVWNWNITDQPRAGESKSGGGDLGSLDFLISSAGQSIALIEALILESGNMSKTEEHITKCFTYLSTSKLHFVVVYFKGPKANFETSWIAYKANVESINYQDNQKLLKEFIDSSDELEKNNIKLGITNHANSANIYHIYLNISSI